MQRDDDEVVNDKKKYEFTFMVSFLRLFQLVPHVKHVRTAQELTWNEQSWYLQTTEKLLSTTPVVYKT